MSTLVKDIVVPEDREVTIKLPSEVVPGDAVITVIVEQKRPNRVGELFGTGKGEIWMSDDFDEPLEFKERPSKRALGTLRGKFQYTGNVKEIGGDELIRLFEERE